MPSSAVDTFADPDDFAASIRATRYELTITGRGAFSAERTRIDLHRLWLQRFTSNLPFVGHSATMRGRAILTFRTAPGPEMLVDGVALPQDGIVRLGEAQQTFQRVAGAIAWGAMSLPVAEIAALGPALAGRDPGPAAHATVARAPPAALARLQRLHAAAGGLAHSAPEVIANPDAARGLEEELIQDPEESDYRSVVASALKLHNLQFEDEDVDQTIKEARARVAVPPTDPKFQGAMNRVLKEILNVG